MILRRFVISIISKFDSSGFDQGERAASSMTEKVDKLGRAQDRTAKDTEELTREVRDLTGAERKATKATTKLGRSQDRAAADARELARAEESAARETRKAGRAADEGGGAWAAFGAELGVAGGAIAGVGIAIAAVAIPILTTGAEFESLRAQLDNLLGSAEKGGDAFKAIQAFATKTPFQLQEVTTAFVKLEGRGIKPTEERLTALGDIASANGKTLDDITEAALDATQGEGERLKEFGIRMKSVGDNVTLSFRGTTLEVAKNEEAITDALVKLGQLQGVAGSMAAQMNTLKGQFSNATDALAQFLNTAAQAGPLETAGEILAQIRKSFFDIGNAEAVGKALDVILKAIRDTLKDVDPKDISDGFEGLIAVLKLVVLVLRPFLALWKGLVKVFGALSRAVSTFERLASAMEEMVVDGTDVVTTFTEIGRALGLLDEQANTAAFGFDNLADAAVNAAEVAKRAIAATLLDPRTDEELLEVAKSAPSVTVRNAAKKILNQRKRDGGKAALEAKDAAKVAAERKRQPRRRNNRGGGGGRKAKAALEGEPESDNILDILGLRGPGSVLEGRPPPQTLIINVAPVIKFIETFNLEVWGASARTLGEAASMGGQAAIEEGLQPHADKLNEVFEAMFKLQLNRLVKANGGGRLPAGVEG